MTTKKRKHKQYQAVEKTPVSDICNKYDIHPSVYYRWQQQFFEGGEKALSGSNEGQVVTVAF